MLTAFFYFLSILLSKSGRFDVMLSGFVRAVFLIFILVFGVQSETSSEF